MAIKFKLSYVTSGSAYALLTLASRLKCDLSRLHKDVVKKSDVRGVLIDKSIAEDISNKYDKTLSQFLKDLEGMWEE